MKRTSLSIFLFVCLMLPGLTLSAESSDESAATGRIVVSGTKFAQALEETTEKVEVITEEEIKESGAKNLTEALHEIPGISFTGHPIQSIMIQGLSGAYVKFMIDGVEVTGDIGGSTPAYQIPVASIERIEIIRGASSALFGSDAMGGVINVITKKDTAAAPRYSLDLTQEVSTALRSYTAARAALNQDNFALSLSGSFDYDGGKTESNGEGGDMYTVPLNRLGSGRVTADWLGSEGKAGLYSTYGNSLIETSSTETSIYSYDSSAVSFGFTGERSLGDFVSVSGFISGARDALTSRNRDESAGTSDRTDTVFADGEGEFRAELTPSISHTIVAGANGKIESIEGDSFEGLKKLVILSAFAQDGWNVGGMDRLILTAGGRLDYSPELEEGDSTLFQATPKLSLRAAVLDETILRLSYGMGYKIPTLKYKYWVFNHTGGGTNFYVLGNPDLEPEFSHGFNVSLDQNIGKALQLSASGYYNLVDNLITTTANGSDSNYSYQNVNSAQTWGGNASARLKAGNAALAFTYAYTAARSYNEVLERYLDLTGRVPHSIGASASYTFPSLGLKLNGSGTWDSPQLVNNIMEYTTPDKLLVNLGAEKSFGDSFEFYLRGDNILNNTHFIEGVGGTYEGQTQKEYFELNDGFILTIGGRLKI